MQGFLYLIQSPNCQRPYLGSTIDINKRIKEHNQGKTKATKNKGPWQITETWKFDDIKIAKKNEYQIKKRKVKLTIENINKFLNKIDG